MLVKTADRLIRLSGALASLSNIGQALRENNQQLLAKTADFTEHGNLGYEPDLQWIEVFTLDAKPVWRWSQSVMGEPPQDLFLQAIAQVRREERPVTLLTCKPLCLLYAFIPILAQGENVGIMVLGQSIADFILDLQLIPNVEVALVMPESSAAAGATLPEWKATIPAITNPAKTQAFLQHLAKRFSNPSEFDKGHVLDWEKESFDIYRFSFQHTLPQQKGFIVFISIL